LIIYESMTSIILRPHQETALSSMEENDLGKIILPTGAGKSIVFIKNTIEQFQSDTPQTVCVVAPRILLAVQLSADYGKHIDNARFIHVHSGSRLSHYRTTKIEDIQEWHNIHKDQHKLIFTSYNSLKKITESNIKVDTYHFDECHNSTKKSFFPHIEDAVRQADKKYFFTATPKNSAIPTKKPGMNIAEVYGHDICKIPMTQMVDGGYVLPPLVVKKEVDAEESIDEMNNNLILKTLDEDAPKKVLISAKSTKYIISLLTETDFVSQTKDRGYSVLHITAAHGAYIDGKEVKRDVFFRTLNEWGNDDSKKFILLNYSILSEGINILGLDAVIFMRNMDVISMCQTIGRVIRIHKEDSDRIASGELQVGDYKNYKKQYGLVVLPVSDDKSKIIADAVESVIYKSFVLGETVTQEIVK
jgi:superfamily II DNA or RNA helicase